MSLCELHFGKHSGHSARTESVLYFRILLDSMVLALHNRLGVRCYYLGMSANAHSRILDFAQNLNPFGPPSTIDWTNPSTKEKALSYGDSHGIEFRKKLATFLGVSPEAVGIGSGATEILFSLPSVIPYARAVIPMPSFWEYEVANRRAGRQIVHIPLSVDNDFAWSLELFKSNLREGDAVFLSNVCNPTSQLFRKEDLLALIRSNPSVHFIIDETYLLFRAGFSQETLTKDTLSNPNLSVVLSLSKIFSLPGLRIGVLVSSPQVVKEYDEKVYIPYSLNPISEAIATQALNAPGFLDETRDFMENERSRVSENLRVLSSKLHVVEPYGNFILCKLHDGIAMAELAPKLLEVGGLFVRSGSEIPGLDDSWFRFCLRSSSENDLLVEALKSIFHRD